MKYSQLFRESLMTVLVSSLFAGGALYLSAHFELPVPEPHQKPVVFIGIVLFSLAFRLLISLKEER